MANEDIITPQWALPFQFTDDGDVVACEQDSDEEIQNNVWAILSYEPGQLIANPDFGINEPTLRKGGVNLDALSQLITRWEPGATEVISRDPTWIKTMIDTITIWRQSGAQ
jgi:hypothetical protein